MKLINGQQLPAVPYIVADAAGVIVKTGLAPLNLVDAQAGAGEQAFVGSANDVTDYIDLAAQAVVKKPAIQPTVTGTTLTGLPVPCEVAVEGQTLITADGSIDLIFDIPGSYAVVLRAALYLDTALTVTSE